MLPCSSGSSGLLCCFSFSFAPCFFPSSGSVFGSSSVFSLLGLRGYPRWLLFRGFLAPQGLRLLRRFLFVLPLRLWPLPSFALSLRSLPLLFLSLPLLRLLPPPDPSSSFSFGRQDDLPVDAPPDALPRVLDPVASFALPESALRRLALFLPLLLLGLCSRISSPSPHLPIFLNWFERIRSTLADVDSRLASFVASGCGDYLFLLTRFSTYAVHGDFAIGGATPVNSSLLSLFEWRLKPTHHVVLTIREAAALEASLRSQSEALSHSMWVLPGWGAFLAVDHLSGSWSPEFSRYSINHRELLAVLYRVRVPSCSSEPVSLPLHGQHHRSVLSEESGRDPLLHTELCGSGHSPLVRGPSDSPGPSVCSGPSECPRRLPQSSLPGPRFRMDPLSPSFSGASLSMAGHHRPLRNFIDSSSPGVLLSGSGSAVGGHRRHDAALGRSAGLCLPSLRPAASCAVEGSAIQGSGAHPCGSVLALAPLVSGSSGASGDCPSVPSTAKGSTRTAPLPSFSPEPPCASSDCISYLERSARSFGFSSAVACQLARC